MEETIKGGTIMRGVVNGKAKYCRIGIRRRRASVAEAIEFFQNSDRAVSELLSGKDEECTLTEEEIAEMRHGQRCMVTAIVALKKMEERND